MRSDLIFKEKSQTINIRKGMFLNINCLQFMLLLMQHQINADTTGSWLKIKKNVCFRLPDRA